MNQGCFFFSLFVFIFLLLLLLFFFILFYFILFYFIFIFFLVILYVVFMNNLNENNLIWHTVNTAYQTEIYFEFETIVLSIPNSLAFLLLLFRVFAYLSFLSQIPLR